MKTKLLLFVAILISMSGLTSHGIENLRISVVASNVVLSWPSLTNETYIRPHRE